MPESSDIADFSSRVEWFTQSRFGMFIHWGTYAMGARHEWVKERERIGEADYQRYFQYFNPDLYDPEKWADAASKAGMRYVVITAKHHEGFCLWDTEHTDYKSTNTPYGKDLLKPFVEAFRKRGIKIGFYYSIIDWHHPHYTIDRMHPRNPQGTPEDYAKLNEGRDMTQYADYMRKQVTELLSNYGEISLMWFDFSFGAQWDKETADYHGIGPGKGRNDWESEKLLQVVKELQPDCLVNNRLDLPEEGDFVTPEQYQPEEPIRDAEGNRVPWEACQTFSGSWGYFRDEESWKSTRQLLWMLIDGVSKGGNLLLNVGPNARGEFDSRAAERLKGIANWMRVHSRSIYGCTEAPEEFHCPQHCCYTFNPKTKRLYLHVFNWPFRYIHLRGMAGKVKYAQLLNDASELPINVPKDDQPGPVDVARECRLQIPVKVEGVEVPVIELFLAD